MAKIRLTSDDWAGDPTSAAEAGTIGAQLGLTTEGLQEQMESPRVPTPGEAVREAKDAARVLDRYLDPPVSPFPRPAAPPTMSLEESVEGMFQPHQQISELAATGAFYTSAEALMGRTLAGRPGEPGLRALAREADIPYSGVRKEELARNIASYHTARDPGLGNELAGLGGVDLLTLVAESPDASADYIREQTARRREIYKEAQYRFGLDVQAVDIAVGGQDPWKFIEGLTPKQWEIQKRELLAGPLQTEFQARGGEVEQWGDLPMGHLPRARQAEVARREGKQVGKVIISGGWSSATLAQQHFLARGVSVPTRGEPPEGLYARGAQLFGPPEMLLQSPGVARTTGGEFVVGDPKKWTKRMSNLAQTGRVYFPGAGIQRGGVKGQLAEVAETVQPVNAWVSMAAQGFPAEGSYLYNPETLGAPHTIVSRKINVPEDANVLVKPGDTFAGDQPMVPYSGHTGLEFGERFEQLTVLQAEVVERKRGKKSYSELLLQMVGQAPTGAPVGLKSLMKGGGYADPTLREMGVDIFMRPTDVYQLGASVAQVATPEQKKEIWGEDIERWGPGSGPRFVEWLLEEGRMNWRQLPERTYQLDSPYVQEMIGQGMLELTGLEGATVTQERLLKLAKAKKFGAIKQILGTTAVRGKQWDYGLELGLGVVPTEQYPYKSQKLSWEQVADIGVYNPRLAASLTRSGRKGREDIANVAGAALAQYAPETPLGKAFAKRAVSVEDIPIGAWQRQAAAALREENIDPDENPQQVREKMMRLIGTHYKGRGIFFPGEGEEGGVYAPNPLSAMRFGYQTRAGQLTQLPGAISDLLWATHERSQGTTRGAITEKGAAAAYRGKMAGLESQLSEVTGASSFWRGLLGTSAGKRRIGGRVVPVSGIEQHRYITGSNTLSRMLEAGGVSSEDMPDLLGQIQAGKIAGPRLLAVRDPALSPEQIKHGLGFMTSESASELLGLSVEEVEATYGSTIGTSALVAALGSGDWDLDALSNIVGSRYSKDKETGAWRVRHLIGQARPQEIIAAAKRAPGAEVQSVLAKIGMWSHTSEEAGEQSVEGLRGRLSEFLSPPPTVSRDELIEGSVRKSVLGTKEMGGYYNIFKRELGQSLRGKHPGLAAAREESVSGYQMALDYVASIPEAWKATKQLGYTYNLASGGFRKGTTEEGEPTGGWIPGGGPALVSTLARNVLGWTSTTGEPLTPEARAATLVNPLVAEEDYQSLRGAIAQYDVDPSEKAFGEVLGLVDPYTGTDKPRPQDYERRMYERSPIFRTQIRLGAAVAVKKGGITEEGVVMHPSGKGMTKFGAFHRQLARWGGALKGLWRATSRSTPPSEGRETLPSRVGDILQASTFEDIPGEFSQAVEEMQRTIRTGTSRPAPAVLALPSGPLAGPAPAPDIIYQGSPGTPSPTSAAEAPPADDLRSRIAQLVQSAIGFEAGAEGGATRMHEFVKSSQQVRRGGQQSPLREVLNKMLGEMVQEERPGAMGLWQEEIGKYGLTMGEGKGGLYHQYREYTGRYESFAAAQKFSNVGDTEPADTPAFVTESEGKLLQKMESKQIPPQAVESAISEKPSSSERFAALSAEFSSMPEEEQAAYRARHSTLDPNADTFGRGNRRYFGPSFGPPYSQEQMAEWERKQAKAKADAAAQAAPVSSQGILGQVMGGMEEYAKQTGKDPVLARLGATEAGDIEFRMFEGRQPLSEFQQMQTLMLMTEMRGMPRAEAEEKLSTIGIERGYGAFLNLVEGRDLTLEQRHALRRELGAAGPGLVSLIEAQAAGPATGRGRGAAAPFEATEADIARYKYDVEQYDVEEYRTEAGAAPPLSRFEQMQRMSRPSREDVVTALAGGEITKKQAVGFLRGKGQMEMTSEVRGILQEVAEVGPTYRDVGPVVQKGLAALGAAGPTDQAVVALERFTETLDGARENLDKYGDTMQEEIKAYQEGRREITPEWKADMAQMIAQAQGVTGAAAALPGGVPQGMAAEVGQWGGLLQQAQGAGLAARPFGAGFAGAGPRGGLQGLMGGMVGPEGEGPMGAGGPFAGAENVFGQLTDYWKMFRMQRVWGMTGGAAMGQIPIAAQQEQAASRAAMATMPMGQATAGDMTLDLMAYGAQRQSWQAQVGRAAAGAWGWTQQGALGEGTATAAGILGPAAGYGALAGMGAKAVIPGLAATSVGIPVAAGLAVMAGNIYSQQAMGDRERMAIAAAEGPQGGRWDWWLSQEAQQAPQLAGGGAGGFGVPGEAPRQAPGLEEYGQQIISGPLAGLAPAGRRTAIQRAVGLATEEGAPLYGFEEPAVSGALEQWYAYTPGAVQQAPGEILEDPRFAAMMMRGTGPQTYAQIGQQWGMEPGRWGEVQEMMGQVPQAQAQDLLFAAGQYAPLQRFMPREQILENVMQPRAAVTGWEAAQLGQEQPGVREWGQMTGEQALQVERLGAMDPMAWSRLGMYGGGIGATGVQVQPGTRELITRHPETGMTIGRDWGGGILAQGIQGGEFSRISELAQEAFQMADITITAENATVQVGGYQAPLTQIGLQDLSTRMQRGEREYQRGLQGEALAVQYAFTTGGALGGVPAAAGAQQFLGRGQWQIQDEMTAAQRGYQETQFGFQREQLGVQDQQFQQRWSLSQQRLQAQAQWGQEDLGTQHERRMTQFGWAEEGLAFQGAKGALQYGWQMEDIEENMRYATGRDRRQLMKQRERATISFGMQMGQLETEEGQLDTRREWAEEDFEKDSERFEIRMGWSEEELSIQMEHHEQNMDLARRRLTESERYYHELQPLQDEMRDTSRALWTYNIGKQVESLTHAQELAGQLDIVQDLLTGIAQSQEATLTEFSAAFAEDGMVTKAFESFAEGVAQPFGPGGFVLNEVGRFGNAFYSMLAGATALVSGYSSTIHNDPYDTDNEPDAPEEF